MNKVNRYLARHSPHATATSQPINRAPFVLFWARNPIFWGQGVKILVPSYRDSKETPFSCWKHWSVGLKLAARGENVLFWPQNLDIWGQKSIFCLVIAIFVDGTNDHYTRGSNFPIGTTPKKFSVSELGVIFWGSPLFLAVFGHSHVRGAPTYPVDCDRIWHSFSIPLQLGLIDLWWIDRFTHIFGQIENRALTMPRN